jgi:hypothetical protein
VLGVSQRSFAAHLSAFIFYEKREMKDAQVFRG